MTEVHWVAVHAGNTTAVPASEVEAIIRSQTNMAAADGGVISRYASHPLVFLARDVIYTSRAYAMMPVRLSVCL